MKKLLMIIVVVLMLMPLLGCGQHRHKVLLIFSYHPEYAWQAEETKGVEEVLENEGVQIEKLSMDTKRNTSAEWIEKITEEAVRKIDEYKPDVVIVFDDNACELVAKKYVGKRLPFVFTGMNGEPEDYGFPAENITGVIERHHIAATIDLLRRLVPDVKELAIITDNSPTSQGFITDLEKTTLPVPISEVYATNDFSDWKAKVEELQLKVDAIGLFQYHTIKEGSGEQSLPHEKVLAWTLQNSVLPDFAFFDFTIQSGALCGVTVSGYEQGKAAGEIAVRILKGENAEDIPIQCPQKGMVIINAMRAKNLGIQIPADVLRDAEVER